MSTLFNSLGALAVIAIAVLQFDTAFYTKPYGHLVVLSLAAFAAACVVIAAVFTFLEGRKRELRELARDAVLEKLATEAVGSKRAHTQTQSASESADADLREKTMKLAHDLFAFLRNHGPEPPRPIDHLATLDKEWEAIGNKYWPYRNRIQHSYARTLHPRVVELLHELAEKDMNAPTLGDFGIDPDVRVEPSALRELAEKLLLIAAKMD